MEKILQIRRFALGLLVVVALACGSVSRAMVACTDHSSADSGHCTETVGHCCAGGDHGAADEVPMPCDDQGDDCPDYPHHHHHKGSCCVATSVFAARVAILSVSGASLRGRAEMEWVNLHCDLDAVRELDTPPIIVA